MLGAFFTLEKPGEPYGCTGLIDGFGLVGSIFKNQVSIQRSEYLRQKSVF